MIVIPMAGLSRRFMEAGYRRPKYMLPLNGRTVFAHAVGSFCRYFETHSFLFIARDIAGTAQFIQNECATLGIANPRVCMLAEPTAGQADTVARGLRQVAVDAAEPLTIFNIDTFRPGFRFPQSEWWAMTAGYLEVFRGSGNNWSYVRPGLGVEPLALETAEKTPISDLCCTGLYYFARAADFLASLEQERAFPSAPELYVAPLYNHLIRSGRCVHYEIVESGEVVFCGVPSEYEALTAAPEV